MVNKGPTPSNSLLGFSVVVSGGTNGGLVGGNPGNPGNSGNPGIPPDPSILGGGNPIPPIKSSAGLSVSFSVEPGLTPIPVGGKPMSSSSTPVFGGTVAGETNSLSNPPGPLGFRAPSGS